MCGIAGIWDRSGQSAPGHAELAAMAAAVRHRGPDGFGVRLDPPVGLSHARLSIIDLAQGAQPMSNEDGSVWITYNGEVYNYRELRPELEARGHRFRTHCDTEVIVHAYEEWGNECVSRFNGNFAFAIWDARRRRMLLARDRLGIRPLYWTEQDGRFLFASETKSLIAAGLQPEFDPLGLDQVFVLWTTVAPRTILRGVAEVPPGHLLVIEPDAPPRATRFWDVPAPGSLPLIEDAGEARERLRALLEDSVSLRLRADVTVGAYLSGGLDSTAATALVRSITNTPLETYSITFADRDYDESREQQEAVRALGTTHHSIAVDYASIAGALPAVVALAEKPILRTAPVPLYLLSRLVREHGTKVVLTGEGADEVFGGYDLFKETKIRAWWAKRPSSRLRPALLRRLYPFAPGADDRARAFFEAFYREGIEDPAEPGFSHRPTWRNGLRNRAFYGAELRLAVSEYDPPADVLALFRQELRERRDPLARAEYLEMKIFLAGHLLASQGDRMSLGNGVEGRYPFLDHRIVELGARLSPRLKLFGLQEKWILRQAVADLLPPAVLARHKRPYVAPNVRAFTQGLGREMAGDLLAEGTVREAGLFDPARAQHLLAKALSGKALGERENMAFIGMMTTHLLGRAWREARDEARKRLDLADFPLRQCVHG